MKKQIVTIHGGDVQDSYAEYLKALKAWKPDKEDIVGNPTMKGWKENLREALGDGYEVLSPEMPNWMNARYEEWELWFEKLMPFLHDGPVFIGHSLGGIFLAQYFANNPDKKKTRALFLVAAPYRDSSSGDKLADFVLPTDLSLLEKLGPKLHLYASEDDPIVDFESFKEYRLHVPEASARVFKDKGHFRMAQFPEIAEEIRDAFKAEA